MFHRLHRCEDRLWPFALRLREVCVRVISSGGHPQAAKKHIYTRRGWVAVLTSMGSRGSMRILLVDRKYRKTQLCALRGNSRVCAPYLYVLRKNTQGSINYGGDNHPRRQNQKHRPERSGGSTRYMCENLREAGEAFSVACSRHDPTRVEDKYCLESLEA